MKTRKQNQIGIVIIVGVLAIILTIFGIFAYSTIKKGTISQYNVFLIDVTDELNPQQKEWLYHNFQTYIDLSPDNSHHAFYRVGATDQELLLPLFEGRVNFGLDNILTKSKAGEMLFAENFKKPLKNLLDESLRIPESNKSPIIQSIQSVSLKSLESHDAKKVPRRIILVSDLMQNTENINFYKGIPSINELMLNNEYRKAMTDLNGVHFDIWRLDGRLSPIEDKKLIKLWGDIIHGQGGTVKMEKISG